MYPPHWIPRPTRYLFGCIIKGQLITWGKMYHIAQATGRTLVMPDFAFLHRKQLISLPTESLYDVEASPPLQTLG